MLCQNCGENEANVKYTQIINGVKKQMNLCENCAKKLGIDNIAFNMPSIDFSNFLGSMFEDEMSEFIPSLIKPEVSICKKCGSSYEDFIKSGKLGCEKCYETFSNQMDVLLKKIHGVNRHIGREGRKFELSEETTQNEKSKIKNQNNTEQNKIQELQARLKQEIREERYEDAAKTRDEIKKLETNRDGDK